MKLAPRIVAFVVLAGSSLGRSATPGTIAPPTARKAISTLEELCRDADLVVLGKVERLERLHHAATPGDSIWDPLPDEVPIAQVRVSKVFKGPAGVETVLFVAARRWACDTTDAEEGETVVLFLEDTSDDAQIDASFRGAAASCFPRGELMSDVAWIEREH